MIKLKTILKSAPLDSVTTIKVDAPIGDSGPFLLVDRERSIDEANIVALWTTETMTREEYERRYPRSSHE